MSRSNKLLLSGKNLKSKKIRIFLSSGASEFSIIKKSYRIFPVYLRSVELEYGNSELRKVSLYKIAVKRVLGDLLENGIYVIPRYFFGYQVEFENSRNFIISDIEIVGEVNTLWISRHAINQGILSRVLDHNIEYNFLRYFDSFSAFIWGFEIDKNDNSLSKESSNSLLALKEVKVVARVEGSGKLDFIKLQNSRVLHGSIVLQNETIYPADIYNFIDGSWPTDFSFKNSGGLVVVESFEDLDVEVERGVFFGTSNGWFHFLVEIFPRYLSADLTELSGRVPILESRVPPQILEVLKLLFDFSPVFNRPFQSIYVQDLYTCIEHRYPDGLSLTKRRVDILKVRDFFKTKFNLESNNNLKLLLIREQHLLRKINNIPAVIGTLKDLGFQVIDPGGLSMKEQVYFFSNASIIVGETGSVLTNLIFCKSNCKIIEINLHNWSPGFFGEFAEILGLKLVAISPSKFASFLGSLGFRQNVSVRKILKIISRIKDNT